MDTWVVPGLPSGALDEPGGYAPMGHMWDIGKLSKKMGLNQRKKNENLQGIL